MLERTRIKAGRIGWGILIALSVALIGGCPGGRAVKSGEPDKVGLFFTLNNRVLLAVDDTALPSERRFNFGKRNPAWNPELYPIAGDFDGTGEDSAGLYIRRQSLFILHSQNVPGWPEHDFPFFPIPGSDVDLSIPLHPVVGDWDGDGKDSVGLYRKDSGEFFLRNENSQGPEDMTFLFGTTNSIPLAGDWDGDGIDTVGVFDPASGRFELADKNSPEAEVTSFVFGVGSFYPLAGDWDGDGVDTIGLYDGLANLFHLKGSLSDGAADRTVAIGGSDPYPTLSGYIRSGTLPLRFPIAGNWNTAGDPQADKPFDWETASPKAQNIDPARLAEVFRLARTSQHLHSLLVIRNGKLVGEEYFNSFDLNSPNCIKSCTKVFTSALVGIAIDQGILENVDLMVKDFLGDYINTESHPWKYQITIHHLLNMRSGILWDNATWNPRMNPTSNWVKFYLDRPMAALPGQTFQYASGCPSTMATVLHRALGQQVDKFAEEVLFGPMGIKATRWDYEPNGRRLTFGPCEIFMQPRDLARLGELYLNDGSLDGKQIVPQEWVEYSRTDHGNGYGNYWWHHGEQGFFTMAAHGYGGQRMYVTPALQLVVVLTSRWRVNRTSATEQSEDNFNLWRNHILPAVYPNPLVLSDDFESLTLTFGMR